MSDPYTTLVHLIAGWNEQARDLDTRADVLERRSEACSQYATQPASRLHSRPDELLAAARANRASANTLRSAASTLEDSIDFARRHVLGERA